MVFHGVIVLLYWSGGPYGMAWNETKITVVRGKVLKQGGPASQSQSTHPSLTSLSLTPGFFPN